VLELADHFGPAFMRSAWKPAIRLSRKDWHFGMNRASLLRQR
jgi:hypothetical protein